MMSSNSFFFLIHKTFVKIYGKVSLDASTARRWSSRVNDIFRKKKENNVSYRPHSGRSAAVVNKSKQMDA